MGDGVNIKHWPLYVPGLQVLEVLFPTDGICSVPSVIGEEI